MTIAEGKYTVLQSVPIWLPQTETWIYSQIKNLPDEFSSVIACKRTENLDQFPWPEVSALSDWPFLKNRWHRLLTGLGIFHHFGNLADILRQEKVRLVHSHFGNMGWANHKIAKLKGKKHVVTFYGYDVGYLPRKDPRWYARYRDMFNAVDLVLCEGPFMAGSIAELGCPQNKVRVQHLGVSLDDLPFKPRRWHKGKPLKVLIAASFREKKGIPYALEALSRLRQDLPIEVTVIGDAGHLPEHRAEKQKILAVVEKHHMHDWVKFLGYQPYKVLIEEAYRHHLFLSPSVISGDGDTEGGAPVIFNEMAATGMPVVSTRHCDIPEVILDGQTGWLAEERDVAGLTETLRRALDDQERWPVMLAAGRNRMETEYDVVAQGQRLGELYRALIEKGY